jgi:hypothetical protein
LYASFPNFSTCEFLKKEKKIQEAYEMLKGQGVIQADPVHVGEAVFAASLPPRQADLSREEQDRLQKLLR